MATECWLPDYSTKPMQCNRSTSHLFPSWRPLWLMFLLLSNSTMQGASAFMLRATNLQARTRLAVFDKLCTKALLFEQGAAAPGACMRESMRVTSITAHRPVHRGI